jgi:hypothetical protein
VIVNVYEAHASNGWGASERPVERRDVLLIERLEIIHVELFIRLLDKERIDATSRGGAVGEVA